MIDLVDLIIPATILVAKLLINTTFMKIIQNCLQLQKEQGVQQQMVWPLQSPDLNIMMQLTTRQKTQPKSTKVWEVYHAVSYNQPESKIFYSNVFRLLPNQDITDLIL